MLCLSPQHRGNNINPYCLFHRDTLINVGWKPYLTFDFVVISHQFNPTPYFTKQLSDSRIKIQNKVRELHNQGLGYTKVHQYLVKNGYKVGKSRTVVDSMIKKMIKREQFFNQEIKLDTYVDFGLEVYRI